MPTKLINAQSVFRDAGVPQTLQYYRTTIQDLYCSDDVPWVVGYSGGKDSTATLQLIWLAIADIPISQRHKPIHVISTDTLVENPIVAAWVTHSLHAINTAATASQLPFRAHRLTPEVEDTFWVNLIGKGYPAPRHKFRWCTERLKIRPSNRFIRNVVRESGEAILALGTRKAESPARARTMQKHEKRRLRSMLSPNAQLPNCLIFTPIEDWSNDDVWLFLMQIDNPWGYRNKDLLTMYQGASQDGECPLVVDTTTPSCGDSRFGCWVCTLVDKDRSMHAMIQNDQEKEWMLPLLELRNSLDMPNDRPLRDFRRKTGTVQLFHDRPIPGPYTQEARAMWLRLVLHAQRWVQQNGPAEVRSLELVTAAELAEIRRIWVVDKHEIEDLLPDIYQDELGEPYPDATLDKETPFSASDLAELKRLCADDKLHYELTRNLLAMSWQYRSYARRPGLFARIDDTIRRGFFRDELDATERARRRESALRVARDRATADVQPASPDDLPLFPSQGTKPGATE